MPLQALNTTNPETTAIPMRNKMKNFWLHTIIHNAAITGINHLTVLRGIRSYEPFSIEYKARTAPIPNASKQLIGNTSYKEEDVEKMKITLAITLNNIIPGNKYLKYRQGNIKINNGHIR